MTANDLNHYFNELWGPSIPWPKSFEVDHITYANVCQHVFEKIADHLNGPYYEIALGPNKGLMFKNVELILRKWT